MRPNKYKSNGTNAAEYHNQFDVPRRFNQATAAQRRWIARRQVKLLGYCLLAWSQHVKLLSYLLFAWSQQVECCGIACWHGVNRQNYSYLLFA